MPEWISAVGIAEKAINKMWGGRIIEPKRLQEWAKTLHFSGVTDVRGAIMESSKKKRGQLRSGELFQVVEAPRVEWGLERANKL